MKHLEHDPMDFVGGLMPTDDSPTHFLGDQAVREPRAKTAALPPTAKPPKKAKRRLIRERVAPGVVVAYEVAGGANMQPYDGPGGKAQTDKPMPEQGSSITDHAVVGEEEGDDDMEKDGQGGAAQEDGNAAGEPAPHPMAGYSAFHGAVHPTMANAARTALADKDLALADKDLGEEMEDEKEDQEEPKPGAFAGMRRRAGASWGEIAEAQGFGEKGRLMGISEPEADSEFMAWLDGLEDIDDEDRGVLMASWQDGYEGDDAKGDE